MRTIRWCRACWSIASGRGISARGIVATPNDFGVNGSPPSHPELLDWLTNEFIANGRRIKPLHRLIVLSSTYRQASAPVDAGQAEQARSRQSLAVPLPAPPAVRRGDSRCDARGRRQAQSQSGRPERDAAGGSRPGPACSTIPPNGPSRRTQRNTIAVRCTWPSSATCNCRSPGSSTSRTPRSVARAANRARTPCKRWRLLERQALEPAGRGVRRASAARVRRRSRAKQVDLAFRLSAGRAPTMREREVSLEFLRTQPLREFAVAMFNLNAFLYVN